MKLLRMAALAAATLIVGSASAETVKIANIGHGYYSGALYVAVQEKLFQKYGLEPEVSYVQGGPLALQAVLTKQVDVGICHMSMCSRWPCRASASFPSSILPIGPSTT